MPPFGSVVSVVSTRAVRRIFYGLVAEPLAQFQE